MSMKIFLLQIDKLRLLCKLFWKSNMETRDCKLSNDILFVNIT